VSFEKEKTMEWTTPQFEEISLNCEINSYASAQV
jgi:coenzyme PQQ precursor peptide PqqA